MGEADIYKKILDKIKVNGIKENNTSVLDLIKEKEELQQELETRKYDINNLTYQLAMTKAELGEANDSAVWWHNRYKAVQRELEKHKKCELKQRIEKAINKIQYIIDIGFDYDGYNDVDNLKILVDELVDLARQTKDILNGRSDE